MALVNLTDFEQLVASYVPFVSQALDFRREKDIQKALTSLYDQADSLAVLLVQDIAAFLWWANHIAQAADSGLTYAAQSQAAWDKADTDTLEAWTQWLNVKYPEDLRALYKDLSGAVNTEVNKGKKAAAESLKKLEAEIAALDKWRADTVTPDLKQWNTFYRTWRSTYLPPLQTLTHWLHSPKTFAAWALPPLIAQAPSMLRKPSLLSSSTAIEQALLATWKTDPNVTLQAIEEWLVTVA